MKVKALTSFAGIISMSENEEKEITDETVVSDLLHAGYVAEVKPKKEGVKKNESKRVNK